MEAKLNVLNGLRWMVIAALFTIAVALCIAEPNAKQFDEWMITLLVCKGSGIALMLLVALMGKAWFGWSITNKR